MIESQKSLFCLSINNSLIFLYQDFGSVKLWKFLSVFYYPVFILFFLLLQNPIIRSGVSKFPVLTFKFEYILRWIRIHRLKCDGSETLIYTTANVNLLKSVPVKILLNFGNYFRTLQLGFWKFLSGIVFFHHYVRTIGIFFSQAHSIWPKPRAFNPDRKSMGTLTFYCGPMISTFWDTHFSSYVPLMWRSLKITFMYKTLWSFQSIYYGQLLYFLYK